MPGPGVAKVLADADGVMRLDIVGFTPSLPIDGLVSYAPGPGAIFACLLSRFAPNLYIISIFTCILDFCARLLAS